MVAKLIEEAIPAAMGSMIFLGTIFFSIGDHRLEKRRMPSLHCNNFEELRSVLCMPQLAPWLLSHNKMKAKYNLYPETALPRFSSPAGFQGNFGFYYVTVFVTSICGICVAYFMSSLMPTMDLANVSPVRSLCIETR